MLTGTAGRALTAKWALRASFLEFLDVPVPGRLGTGRSDLLGARSAK